MEDHFKLETAGPLAIVKVLETTIVEDRNVRVATGVGGVTIFRAGGKYFVSRFHRGESEDGARSYAALNEARSLAEARRFRDDLIRTFC